MKHVTTQKYRNEFRKIKVLLEFIPILSEMKLEPGHKWSNIK